MGSKFDTIMDYIGMGVFIILIVGAGIFIVYERIDRGCWNFDFLYEEEIEEEFDMKNYSCEELRDILLLELFPREVRRTTTRQHCDGEIIKWDKELNCFICKPIEGYNKNTYRLTKKGTKFECSCQFYSKTGKICSHVLALFMMLKIWRSQK